MNKPTEEIREVVLIGYKKNERVKLAYSNAIERSMINNSNFVMAGNENNDLKPAKIVGLMNSIGGYAIGVWELSNEDGVYRMKVDVEISSNYFFCISRIMPDGSERRTDVSIVH